MPPAWSGSSASANAGARMARRSRRWCCGRAGGAAGLGQPGLYLRRTADADTGRDRAASGRLWRAHVERRGGGTAGADQRSERDAALGASPHGTAALAARRARTGQQRDARCAHDPCPASASPGTRGSRAIARSIWSTMRGRRRRASMPIPCNWWMWPRAGVSGWRCPIGGSAPWQRRSARCSPGYPSRWWNGILTAS